MAAGHQQCHPNGHNALTQTEKGWGGSSELLVASSSFWQMQLCCPCALLLNIWANTIDLCQLTQNLHLLTFAYICNLHEPTIHCSTWKSGKFPIKYQTTEQHCECKIYYNMEDIRASKLFKGCDKHLSHHITVRIVFIHNEKTLWESHLTDLSVSRIVILTQPIYCHPCIALLTGTSLLCFATRWATSFAQEW